MLAKLHTTLHIDGRANDVSGVEVIPFDGPYEKDLPAVAGETQLYPLQIQLNLTAAIVIVASVALSIVLGKFKKTFQAGEPLIWTRGSGAKCFLEADTNEISVTAPGQESGTLYVRVLELAKPVANAVPATPEPAPVPAPAAAQLTLPSAA